MKGKEMPKLTLEQKIRKVRNDYQLYLLLLPAVVLVIVFNYIPMYGITIAFKNYSPRLGILGSEWIGFVHFERFFASPFFWRILYNTISLSVYQLAVGFFVPIVIAIMLNSLTHTGIKKKIQLIIYAPHFISMVVLVGMIYVFTSQHGLINNILGTFGIDPIMFMSEAKWFRPLYVLTGVWKDAGWASIIYLAALANVPPELNEAAIMDGANPWQRILHIDLPTIKPVITVLFVLAVGNVMNLGFEKAFLMQTPLNLEASEIIPTYVYKLGLQRGEFSFSTAVGLFNAVINLVLLVTVNYITKKTDEDAGI